jgi:hypothetical protein
MVDASPKSVAPEGWKQAPGQQNFFNKINGYTFWNRFNHAKV